MDARIETKAPPQIRLIGSQSQSGKLQVVDEKRKFRPHIYWYLSFRCNLACKHCSVFSSPSVDTSTDLTTEDCMQVIEQMAELDVALAMLTGGEVLIRPDALQILRALADKGIAIGLETNGLRFTEEFAVLARELQERKLLQVTISLDGGTRETHETLRGPNSFDRTVRNLFFLKEKGIRFDIQAVLNKSNYHTIPNLYELAAELFPQLRFVQFAFLNGVGRGTELIKSLGLQVRDFDEIFDLIKREKPKFEGYTLVKGPPALIPPKYLGMVFQDKAIRKSVSCQFPLLGVLPNGDVTICAVSRDNEDLYFGNVRQVRLKEVWWKTRMDMLRSRYMSAEHLTGICGDCVWKYACKGGCRAWAYEEGESFDAPLPICAALEAAGEFRKAYRISHQNEAMVRHFQSMGGGCSCG